MPWRLLCVCRCLAASARALARVRASLTVARALTTGQSTFNHTLRVLRRRIFIHVGSTPTISPRKQPRNQDSKGSRQIVPKNPSPAVPAAAPEDTPGEAKQGADTPGAHSQGADPAAATAPTDATTSGSVQGLGGAGGGTAADKAGAGKDSTFVLLCKGSCTSGQTGILYDREAEMFIENMKQRDCGQVWVLTPQDFVIKGMPSRCPPASVLPPVLGTADEALTRGRLGAGRRATLP